MALKALIEVIYLLSTISFIAGLKLLSNPDYSRKGIWVSATGMAMAVFVTIGGEKIHNHGWIFSAIIVGAVMGILSAKRVRITSMPQIVSFFNATGGACASVISVIEFNNHPALKTGSLLNAATFSILTAMMIGTVSFSGSIIAQGKLQGFITERALRYPLQKTFNLILLSSLLLLATFIMFKGEPDKYLLYLLAFLSILYGILFVLPIGGPDMPVIISLLNSLTGIATACIGFLLENQIMLTGGVLVGSAGAILTLVMCNTMNRSIFNVIFNNSNNETNQDTEEVKDTTVNEIAFSDAAILLSFAKKVIIIPGYGLAVAQAQHICYELFQELEKKDVEVKFAIHPIAGRMPGHMNVLLAEAEVPYEKLFDLEQINEEFRLTNVALIIGANDIVNPAAHNDPDSPIFGMPVLDAESAANIIVIKRTMNSGFAGLKNNLFINKKTKMLFGDAKPVLIKLLNQIKDL